MEEILLKKFRTGTTINYFSTLLDERYSSEVVPAFVLFNNSNQPISLHTFDGVSLWSRNNDNNFVPLSSVVSPNEYITGKTFSQTTDFELSTNEIDKIKNKFIASANSLYSGKTVSYIFNSTHLVDDVFTTVKISKTTDVLDTLSVYNNIVNTIPIQEATTGVVFGKLEAIQKIKTKAGNNARIPLRNVPIGIFAASDEFPAATSFDENGDRLILNYKETADSDKYHDQKTYDADIKYYLRSSSGLTQMPNHLRYVTKTNDNGEFVLHDVPVGTQTLIFEVDLLSQGLTKDEVALNRFPYPGNTDSNVDYIPHFFFQQVPIDVVPAWGPGQSGYTEVNIAANIDLRKWATYYICPITYRERKIDSADMLAIGITSPLRVEVRDMSKQEYPTTNIPVVEIHEMLARDKTQTLEWRDEIAQLKDAAEFRDHDFHAFKVPANIYDPIGINSVENNKAIASNNYIPTSGVWLAAYQFKMAYIDKVTFRSTGLEKLYGANGLVTRSHFSLNRGNTDTTESNISTFETRRGAFPYSEPWTEIYPEPYSIPRPPEVLNPAKTTNSNGVYQGDYRIPKYLDGDMVGAFPTNTQSSGGYGIQFYSSTNQWISNRFSKRVTKDFVYKYENGNSWAEEYANGYQPSNSGYAIQPGVSKVLNGEKYQRVEAGFAYWLRPDGWPKVEHFATWSDGIRTQNLPVPAGNNTAVYLAAQQDITLRMEPVTDYTEGALEIYRIINPSSENLVDPDPAITITKANFDFHRIYRRKGKTGGPLRAFWCNQGDQGGDQDDCYRFGHLGSTNFFFTDMKIRIRNTGEAKTNIKIFLNGIVSDQELSVGQELEVDVSSGDHTDGPIIQIEGNGNFDFNNFKFTRARCRITFSHFDRGSGASPDFSPDESYSFDTDGVTDINPPTHYLYTKLGSVITNITQNLKGDRSCNDRASTKQRDIVMKGFVFGADAGNTSIQDRYWSTDGYLCNQAGGHCCDDDNKTVNDVLKTIGTVEQ